MRVANRVQGETKENILVVLNQYAAGAQASPHSEDECYWNHPDHLGSASWVSDKAGKGIQYLYYLPWGEELDNQRATDYASRYTFSGKERDVETGYGYFGARYYNSDLSIWLSVDPLADKYPGLSPYTYCANNPVRLIDPDGREFVDSDGNRVRVRVLKDGTIQYKFSPHASDAVKTDFISRHEESLSALAKTKMGKRCINFLNRCYTKVSITPTDESGNQNSFIIPLCDDNNNIIFTDGIYESVTIKPYMGSIRNKASEDCVDVDEILGATLIVEAGHLSKAQISRDYNNQISSEQQYYRLYNGYVNYRFNYRKEMNQQIDGTVFNNSSYIKPELNLRNTKRQKKYVKD